MNITQKHKYGLSAMVVLARFAKQGPVQLRVVSEQAKVPHAFLEQLILDLKRVGLVKSTRGAKGGYQLALSPAKITLNTIFSAIDPLECVVQDTDPVGFIWSDFNATVHDCFNVSLQSVLDSIVKKERVLTYSI